MAMNFIAQSMRRFGLAPDNKKDPQSATPTAATNTADPLSHLKIGSKWAYSTLEYPLDIQSRSDLGHYMMFYINVPTNSPSGQQSRAAAEKKQSFRTEFVGSPMDHMRGTAKKVTKPDNALAGILNQTAYSQKASGPSGAAAFDKDGSTWIPGESERVIERKHYEGNTSRVLGEKRTMRTKDSIVLYMPPNITENYAAVYKEGELGRFGGEGADVAKQALNAFRQSLSESSNATGGGNNPLGALNSAFSVLSSNANEKAAETLGQAGGGDLKGMMLKADNKAINNFLEVMFTGIGHRKFSYTWKIAPKSAEESSAAYNIIQKFKYHMAPEIGGGNFGRYFTVPSEFDIFYMFRGEENSWIHKISSCVLLNLDVNYTPNQYQTFRPHKNRKGAPPTEMDLKLDFMETRLITKELINDGY